MEHCLKAGLGEERLDGELTSSILIGTSGLSL